MTAITERHAVRWNAIRDEQTRREGWYRGQDVAGHASVAFGEEALSRIEAYLEDTIERVFTARRRSDDQD